MLETVTENLRIAIAEAKHLPGMHKQETHGRSQLTVDDATLKGRQKARDLLERLKNEHDPVTREENKAISDYVSSSEFINGALRDGKFVSGTWDSVRVHLIDAVIDRGSLSEPIIVHRGMGPGSLMDNWERLSIGDVLVDKAFTSTSLGFLVSTRFGQGEGQIWVEIHLPRGQKYTVGDEDELEIILPREQKFKIVAKEEIDYTKEIGEYRHRLVLEPVNDV